MTTIDAAITEPMNSDQLNDIDTTFRNLHGYLLKNDFKGWEYDDLLASPFVNAATFNLLYPKIAAVQISKRSPINLRPLLGVPKLKSTKAFGFIVKGYLLHDASTKKETYRKYAVSGLD